MATEDAGTHAARAATQGKHAAKNAAKAAQAAAEPVLREVEDTAEVVAETAKRVDVHAVSRGLSKTGQGFIALSIAVTAAAFAFTRFRKAREEDYVVEEPQVS